MEFLQHINSNYSGILSVAVAMITAFITLAYVIFTYKQMKATKVATETAIKQLQSEKQPCVMIEISKTEGTKCFTKTRRQLHIELTLNNIGDSPALSIYTFAHLELQYTKHIKNGSNIVNMDYVPDFNRHLKAGVSTNASVRFETFEINMLVEDLRISYEKNMQRIKENPSQHHCRGTILVVEVYYRNVLGQWFKNTIRQEIAWLKDKNALPRKTGNINENTIPPCPLTEHTEFELQLVSSSFSVFSTELTEAKEIEEKLEPYKEYLQF